ncbi:MAG: IS200/IS605 family transposase [Methanosarcina barkeri]|nr:IS200/IS605 family transposase [Methanosarcina sp. ERenArc_MAG2]
MELRHANHCVYKIRYHMVFCVKYRKKLLLKTELVNFLKNVCFEISERYCFEFDAIGSDGDHVHLFVGAEPKYSPSKIMQIIKSITARQIFKQYPEIKKHLWDGELWSDGGYIGTVGDGITSDVIKNYVENQGNQEEKEAYQQMKILDFE